MIIAITGATSGIGLAATKLLVQRGETVVMACRNPEKTEAKRREIAQALQLDDETANARMPFVKLDLGSIQSCRNAARELDALHIDALYNNGGSMFSDWALSTDKIERNIATNCLGPAVLSEELASCTSLKTIVHTVSISCKVAKIDQSVFSCEQPAKYTRLGNYSTSKLAGFLYVSKRCELGSKQRVVAFDPGVVNTGMITQERWFDPLADIFFRPFIRKPETAAKIAIRALDDDQNHKLYRGKKTDDFPAFIQNHPLRDWLWDELMNRIQNNLQ